MDSAAPLSPVPRQSLVASTIDSLRARLTDGTWRIGDRLPPEAELASGLGVGRNTVREAVRALSHSRMLEVRQGDGTYVRSVIDPAETIRRIDRTSIRDHLELQSMLEAEAARFAARRRTDDDLMKLRTLLEARGERTQHGDLEEFLRRDREFHLAVAAAAHNTAIEELYRYFAIAIATHTAAIRDGGELPEPDLSTHRAIVDAIERRDEHASAAAARLVLAPRIARLGESISATQQR